VEARDSESWNQETQPSRRAERSNGRIEQPSWSGDASIPLWVWFLGVVVVLLVVVVCGLWALYTLRGRWEISGPTPTPIIWTPTPLPEPTATATLPPTEEIFPTVSPGIAVGRYVRVSGTEGSGLSLREGPGANFARMDVALEGEVFIVIDGPRVAGDAEWWKIRDPDNERRDWWAAGNYLEPVENPYEDGSWAAKTRSSG
jgi:hypothetical protein